jgi:hypothetical protein
MTGWRSLVSATLCSFQQLPENCCSGNILSPSHICEYSYATKWRVWSLTCQSIPVVCIIWYLFCCVQSHVFHTCSYACSCNFKNYFLELWVCWLVNGNYCWAAIRSPIFNFSAAELLMIIRVCSLCTPFFPKTVPGSQTWQSSQMPITR